MYRQPGAWPDKGDVFLGLFTTRELAAIAVDSVNNNRRAPGECWVAIGRLIYPVGDMIGPDDFYATMTDRYVAHAVVAAVNGVGAHAATP